LKLYFRIKPIRAAEVQDMRSTLFACVSLLATTLAIAPIDEAEATSKSAGRASKAAALADPVPASPTTRLAQARSTAPGPIQRSKTLQVAYVKNLSFAPLYLAIEKGYLAQEGIEAECPQSALTGQIELIA
jgi:ABC-type nitrate/sulfonate/bicarbonate transport system substrate-binding protein